jgi:DNA-binding transcriptional MerR regulator
MKQYSVKKLAKLAGVSVRTLHLYDQNGLLKPAIRTEAGYRMYGEAELLRLQQILFYKELDFSLQAIQDILNDPHFDLIRALESHKLALHSRQERIQTLMATIDTTIHRLKTKKMLSHEELYAGLPKETATTYRNEAMAKYGVETVASSEKHLGSLGKEGFQQLKVEMADIANKLIALMQEDPHSAIVQQQIARHYHNIRGFWGTAQSSDLQAEAYAGLGDLYVADERFTLVEGKANPAYAQFLQQAMRYFADTQLK